MRKFQEICRKTAERCHYQCMEVCGVFYFSTGERRFKVEGFESYDGYMYNNGVRFSVYGDAKLDTIDFSVQRMAGDINLDDEDEKLADTLAEELDKFIAFWS